MPSLAFPWKNPSKHTFTADLYSDASWHSHSRLGQGLQSYHNANIIIKMQCGCAKPSRYGCPQDRYSSCMDKQKYSKCMCSKHNMRYAYTCSAPNLEHWIPHSSRLQAPLIPKSTQHSYDSVPHYLAVCHVIAQTAASYCCGMG